MAPSFKFIEALRNFDWKANWRWVAIGGGAVAAVIIVTVVVVVVASGDSCGSSSSNDSFEDYQQYFLKENNWKRKLHHAAPLELSEKLTEIAIKCAKYYVTELGGVDNSCEYPGEVGATGLALGCGVGSPPSPLANAKIVSRLFYNPAYQYFDNPQTDGAKYFTAYVWKGAKKIGVGFYKQGGAKVFSVVYCPAINVEGKFKENVLPKT